MSIERTATTTLHCDHFTCLAHLRWQGYLPKATMQARARKEGWHAPDKLGRHWCPAHRRPDGRRKSS